MSETLSTLVSKPGAVTSNQVDAPLGMLCELTYRCPLQCGYCSNPLDISRGESELSTKEWQSVMRQAAKLGVLQIHLSGGEPCVRADLEEILKTAVDVGLYTNLITSGVTLKRKRLEELVKIGLDHVQLSFQDVDPKNAQFISNYKGGVEKKREVARWVKELGLPLTMNVVIHRHNIENTAALIDYAVEIGAGRIELAHVQYYAWALKNRAALIPTREQFYQSVKVSNEARERLKGVLVFDVVAHDQYAVRPKACMGGWGKSLFDITPSGKMMPCQACESIPGIKIDNVRDTPLADIWYKSNAFQMFRGTSWMKEPCKSCDRREIDWGGCRCQALAVTGDARATDPACHLSTFHEQFAETAEQESRQPSPPFIYRRIGGVPEVS